MPGTTVVAKPDKKSVKRLARAARQLSKVRKRQMKRGMTQAKLTAIDTMIDRLDALRLELNNV